MSTRIVNKPGPGPDVIAGVTFEPAWRGKSDASIVILARRGGIIHVLESETMHGLLADCLDMVLRVIQECPEKIDEVMAGNEETLRILLSCKALDLHYNLPRRSRVGGEHVLSSIDRLRGRNL